MKKHQLYYFTLILLLLTFKQGFGKNLNTQNNDLQLLYDDSQVAIIEITIDPDDLEWIYDNPSSNQEHLAQMRFQNANIDKTVDSIGFRIRGNTSRSSQKKSFKVSFNTFVKGRQFYGVDKLNLNGEHNDPSIIRSKLCWDLFQQIGAQSSAAAHAAVYINADYYGLYISVEHIDDEFLENHFADASGNLWKCLYPADLVYKGNDPDLYKEYSGDRQAYDLKTNTEEDDYSQLARLIDIINNISDENFADSLSAILNVPDVLKYFAVNILTGGWDDYWFLKNNYYLYYEPGIEKFRWIPYDYDNTFGIDWFDISWSSVNPYIFEIIDGLNSGNRPLAERIMETPRYRNLYTHFLEFYKDNVFNLSLWESKIDNIKSLITPWAEQDNYRTLDYGFSMNDFHNSYSGSSYSNQHVKTGIKQFILLRSTTLGSQLSYLNAPPNIYSAEYFPHQPEPGDSMTIITAAFSHSGFDSIYVKCNSSAGISTFALHKEPVEGTSLVSEFDRYICKIPVPTTGSQFSIQIHAVDPNGNQAHFPANKPIVIEIGDSTHHSLQINEFLAINDANITDEFDQNDDWLELYNSSDQSVSLNNLYLTDDPANLTKYQFPDSNLLVQPQNFKIIWADNDQEQGALHTNFRISGDGEFLALVSYNGTTIIDSITFGQQTPDISFGRNGGGSENWGFFEPPTPGSANPPSHIIDTKTVPVKFSVTNFPNPFNARTVLQINLPEPDQIKLSVYDINGREIQSLLNKRLSAGKYQFFWNGKNSDNNPVASGIYFCLLEGAHITFTKKLILLR